MCLSIWFKFLRKGVNIQEIMKFGLFDLGFCEKVLIFSS